MQLRDNALYNIWGLWHYPIQSDELTGAYIWQSYFAAWRWTQIKTLVLCIDDRTYLLENWRAPDPCKLYHKKTTYNDLAS